MKPNRPKKLLHYEEWQGSSGLWYCNDTSDLCSARSYWWAPARMLNISPVEFVQLLINQFHPDKISYNPEADVLIYGWNKIADERVFKNWINAQARKYQFII